MATTTTSVGDITSANATLVLTVKNLYSAGITLQQFSTDQSYSQGDMQIAEDRMGVDGQLVAGWIPNIKTVTISLEASSPSYAILSSFYRACERKKGFYECTLVASVPSIKKKFTWSGGILKSGTVVPAGRRVLDATQWVFDFQDLKITNVG